jgi:cbb3-type cytochrome oxidase subunit 3
MKTLKISLLIFILYLASLLTLWLIPSNNYVNFKTEYYVLSRLLYYYLKFTPLAIIIIALIEIRKDRKTIQSWITGTLSFVLLLYGFWVSRPHPRKELVYENLGHVSFESNGQDKNFKYYCNYDFDVQVILESESADLRNEINFKRKEILDVIDQATRDNCTESDIQDYINQKYLGVINDKLENGEITSINFNNRKDSVSTNGIKTK